MNSHLWLKLCRIISVAVLITTSTVHLDGAEKPGTEAIKRIASTNQIALDAVVADILANNPEVNFYSVEIDAAKGTARTAAAWANPEISSTVGDKRVAAGGVANEGIAWLVSVRQTFEWP